MNNLVSITTNRSTALAVENHMTGSVSKRKSFEVKVCHEPLYSTITLSVIEGFKLKQLVEYAFFMGLHSGHRAALISNKIKMPRYFTTISRLNAPKNELEDAVQSFFKNHANIILNDDTEKNDFANAIYYCEVSGTKHTAAVSL